MANWWDEAPVVAPNAKSGGDWWESAPVVADEPGLEIDVVGGTPVAAEMYDAPALGDSSGIVDGLKRLGWGALDGAGGYLPNRIMRSIMPERWESNLDKTADLLGAQESLQEYRAFRDRPEAVPQSELGADLGVMTHYNPDTGQVEYPMADASSLGTLGRGVLGGALANAGGGVADLLNIPSVWLQNEVIAPFTGQAKLPYDGAQQGIRSALGDAGVIPRSVTDLPEDRRAAYYGGEAFGAALPIAGGMGLVNKARQGANIARIQAGAARPVGNNVRTMFDGPSGFGGPAVQIGSATGAGFGAAAGETIAPGNPEVRIASEIVGSILHPSALASRVAEAGGGVRSAAQRVISGGGFSREALQDRGVQRALIDNIKRAGEDPAKVLADLQASRSGDLAGFTTDVATGSEGLRNMRTYLRRQNPDFAKQIDQKNSEAWDLTVAAADRMATSGSPEAIQSAAKLYRTAFDDMFRAHVQAAETRATQAASRLGPNSTEQMAAAGQDMAEVVNDAYQAAKTFERAAWRNVPTDMQITPTATREAIRDGGSRVVDIQSIMPDIVRRFSRDILPAGDVTSGELKDFYFRLRDGAQTLRAADRAGDAATISRVADSVLDDLANLPNMEASRLVSRELHAAFDRGFAGQLLNNGAYGASRFDPVTAAGRAVGGGSAGTQRMQRASELRTAAEYDPNVGLSRAGMSLPEVPSAAETAAGAAARGGGMQEALEQANLARLRESVDPQTGRVQPNMLARRLEESQVLDTPASQYLGEAALSAEQAAQRTASRANDRMARLDDPQQSTLARVLNREGQASTANIVDATLKRADSVTEYERIANVAKNRRLPEDVRRAAIDDLGAGTIRTAMDRAGGSNGPFGVDMVKARRALLDSPGGGKPSPIELMEQNGVVTQDHARRIRQLFTRASEAQTSIANNAGDIDVASPSAWFDTLSRIAGAKVGGGIAQKVFGGNDIQTPGIMSRLFQRTLRAMPQYNPQQAMLHVIMDPNALQTALEAASTRQGMRLTLDQARRMNMVTAGMLQAGLIPKEAYDEITLEIEQASGE